MIRRKNYFIKKNFQFNFSIKFALLLLLEAGLIAIHFMYIARNTLTTGYVDSILTIDRTPNFFFTQFLLIVAIVALGIGIVGMVIFILLSHRIAGPLYRFEKDLEEITAGDLTKRISIRRTDQISELRDSLNILIESLDQKMGRIKNHLLELKALLPKKDEPVNASKISEILEAIENEIDRFKVTSGLNE